MSGTINLWDGLRDVNLLCYEWKQCYAGAPLYTGLTMTSHDANSRYGD